jgi:sortase A
MPQFTGSWDTYRRLTRHRALIPAVWLVAVLAALSCFSMWPTALQADPPLAGISQPAPVGNPVELRIPSLGVDAAVQSVGVEADGSMGIPSNFEDVAWFASGYKPGEDGRAVFDGHVSSTDAAAVFYHVEDLRRGSRIYVTDEDGVELTFQVTEVDSYPLDRTPVDTIFAGTDWPQVVLITCGGEWHPDVQLFDHRTVVYASLVTPESP